MCHMRWRPLHRPRAERPLMTAPQPVRDASVANDNWRHGAPSTGPWFKNQGFLHMSRARTHRRETLIMGKIPWFWATTAGVSCTAGQMVSHWTQLPSDPAISETAWQWVTGLLSLSWLTWKSTRSEQETLVPASWSNSTPRLNKWSSEPEKAHFLWRLVSTPTVSYERGWHLDVSPPPSPTELESASRRYNLVSDALQPQWS